MGSSVVQIWDIENGVCLNTYEAVLCKSEHDVTTDEKGAFSKYQDLNGKGWIPVSEVSIQTKDFEFPILMKCVTPDGKIGISVIKDWMDVWDIESGKRLRSLIGHKSLVKSVCITADGKRAISGSWDGTLILWDIVNAEYLKILKGHMDRIYCVSMTPDGKMAISGDMLGHILVWNLERGRSISTAKDHLYEINSVHISPDTKKAISGSYDGTIRLWDLENGRHLKTLRTFSMPVLMWGDDPDSVINIPGMEHMEEFMEELGNRISAIRRRGISRISVTPDGKRVISAHFDNILRVWDITNERCIAKLRLNSLNEVFCISKTPDGRQAVSGSKDGSLRLWDIESGEYIAAYQAKTSILSISEIRADGYFVCGGSSGEIIFLTVYNFPKISPIVTPSRIWQYGKR